MLDMPPGWYADPHQPAQQRWWDGAQWSEHTAPPGQAPAAAVAEAPAAKSSQLKTWLIVGGVILAITLLTRSLGVLMMLAGLFLFFVAIYGIVRGSVKLFRVRSRGAALATLGIALVLMLAGSGANAALGGPGSSSSEVGSSGASVEPKPFAATSTAKPTPTPTPKPTTFEEVEESTAIPFERTTVDDPNIDVGQAPITTVGADGTKVTTYKVTYVDGVEVSRDVVREAVTVAPVNEVTSNGTRQPPPPPPPAPVPLVQPAAECHGSYAGVCVPIASDVDCEGGSGDGPAYVRGPLRVVGEDVYDLDRDGDGVACDK